MFSRTRQRRSATAADDLLLRLIRQDWDPAARQLGTICDDADWTVIVQTALRHGVAGLMCRGMSHVPAGEIPQDIFEAAGTYLENAEGQGDVLVAQVFDVLDVLREAGVPALPFKGPALGTRAHASATIRPSRDIDILVHRPDMERAIAALGRLDYRLGEHFSPRVMAACFESYGQEILFADGRFPVEPHWAFAPKALAVDLDMSGIWDRAVPLAIADRVVPALSAEDELLVACLHGSKEKWWRLLWVADVAAFVHRQATLDWNAMLKRAETSGTGRMFLLGLALAKDLFSTPLPASVASAIERDAMCRHLVEESKHHIFAPGFDVGSVHEVTRYHLRARERASDRVRYVLRTIMTPQCKHYRMIELPGALVAGYVPIKLVHDYVLWPLWSLSNGRCWRRRNPVPDVAR